jgi:hypothetical protein
MDWSYLQAVAGRAGWLGRQQGPPEIGMERIGALRRPAFDVDPHLYEAFGYMVTGRQRWTFKEILLLISG